MNWWAAYIAGGLITATLSARPAYWECAETCRPLKAWMRLVLILAVIAVFWPLIIAILGLAWLFTSDHEAGAR